jgi:hypothetical protein
MTMGLVLFPRWGYQLPSRIVNLGEGGSVPLPSPSKAVECRLHSENYHNPWTQTQRKI